MDILYYPGCSLRSSSELYDAQTKIVLGKLGVNLQELEDWNCCGATSAAKTDEWLAIALPARNLGLADASGLSSMVIPCSACYSRMLVAQKRLEGNDKLLAEINAELQKKVRNSVQIMSILEVLRPLAESGDLVQKASRKLTGLKAACYYGCLQTRFPLDVPVPDDVENPQGMEIICKALGAETLDWSYKTDCCGASASVNDPDAALKLMSKIMKDALARGANCFVCTCPMCQLNLDAYQNQVVEKYGIDRKLPVYFITELVGVAMGLSPRDLQIDRHFVDSMGLLKELELI
ncbi:CoB--CoM heterodisulfide reductase iron-sulfur subunit B family protein [Desulforhabdus amnigena]|jgi:heterodisulfide reductase subunit B|uniref:Cysteine-rich domain-containing protein n=1 Tax=Desulforhabdus amnigena TaxID=40218 RepID=A0A9W6FVK2_9BACT|nr:CoB--CoM heterodisulfide reductase iron-sulfur subunit B family protein [Desulforhabdus amnigena]NLJ29493.1 CoB--CoM heterodisulfide reductase [Deltaproteobacteria bacterium]GLI35689.1 hypothetical protein DAMNIGENAA_31220 [Desulforhabdus amnigena]